jgi:hypothetical protein
VKEEATREAAKTNYRAEVITMMQRLCEIAEDEAIGPRGRGTRVDAEGTRCRMDTNDVEEVIK